jgi:hypothetical protein
MPTFQKCEVVDASKYEGPALTVVNDQLGEQAALPGDYLLGTERGKIRVMGARQFEAEFVAYSKTPCDDQLAAARAVVADLKGKSASLAASSAAAEAGLSAAQAELAAEKAKLAELQAKYDALASAAAPAAAHAQPDDEAKDKKAAKK